MPAPLFSLPLPSVARHGRTLVAVVGTVLLAHWLVLGQPLKWTVDWAPTSPTAHSAEEGPEAPALQTRTITLNPPAPAVLAPQAPPARALAVPPAPRPAVGLPPRFAPLPPSEPPAAATLPDALALASKLAPASVDSAQTAPNIIANEGSPPPPSGPQGSKNSAVAVTTLAAGAAQAGDAPLRLAYPEPARLKYEVRAEVKGISLSLNGELLWQHDGKTYNSRLEFSHFLLGSRMQTSKGALGPQGLEPLRFGDKVRSEVAAHFDRSANKVTFSANTPDVPLTPGMQDQLSAVLQLSAMFGGEPQRYPAGTQIPFEAIGPRSVESWTMVVGNTEKLALPGGEVSAIKLSRGAAGPHSNRAEIWLAPSMGYLPVRIRLTEANGDVADKLWRSTQAP
nr:DUF3108 domain-containing protein [uncultured Rhodoferax sp.]